MTTFWTIVGDTWRQSRKQVVFIIMIILLFLFATTAIVLPKSFGEGESRYLGTIFGDEPEAGSTETDIADEWLTYYCQGILASGEKVDMGRAMNPASTTDEDAKAVSKVIREAHAEAASLSLFQKGVEVWLNVTARCLFTISMLMFIAACAGYYPDLLDSGAIDSVLSKPVGRLTVYLSKFVGGMILYSIVVVAAYLVVFVGFGIRFGVWHTGLFLVIPLQIFAAAILYSILALIGTLWRSATLAVVIGYMFYVVVDTIIGAVQGMQIAGGLDDFKWLDTLVRYSRIALPNFEHDQGSLRRQRHEFAAARYEAHSGRCRLDRPVPRLRSLEVFED